jgi:hypothetical protein
MTTYFPPKAAVLRSNFLHAAAILSATFALGYAVPASADSPSAGNGSAATVPAQAPNENTMARCEQLYGLWSKHNTDGYAKPLDARMALEDCQKGNIPAGVASLKRSLQRAQIAIPPADAGVAQSPATSPATSPAPATLRPHGEKRRVSQ